jgi:hypothetical protein
MLTIFYSPSTRGFYRDDVPVPVPPDAVEIEESNYLSLLEGQEQGLNIVPGLDGVPVLADPPPPTLEQVQAANIANAKYAGVEFDGVMCSATSADQNGLMAVFLSIQIQGASFVPTRFSFENGSELVITLSNYQAFMAVWLPFRQSFYLA